MREAEGSNLPLPRRPWHASARLGTPPKAEGCPGGWPLPQASEPNTLHSLFASLCGMRPHLGMDKLEYSHQQRLAQCLPARLRAEAIHSGFYTTSNVGMQHKLGFGEVWSSMDDYPNSSMLAYKKPSGARKRTKTRLRWPKQWWKRGTAALLQGRSAGQYNWLGDHDFFGLPKARGTLRPARPPNSTRPNLRRCTVRHTPPHRTAPHRSGLRVQRGVSGARLRRGPG